MRQLFNSRNLTLGVALALYCFSHTSLMASEKASNSKALDIPANFVFATYRELQLDLHLDMSNISSNDKPLPKIVVSSIKKGITDLDDPRLQNKHRLVAARPDEFGRVYRALNIASSVSSLLIETYISGQSVRVIVDVSGRDSVHQSLRLPSLLE